jgi:hypothetical protein
VREAWRLTAPPAEAQAQADAMVEAAGAAAQEAGEVAEEAEAADTDGDASTPAGGPDRSSADRS